MAQDKLERLGRYEILTLLASGGMAEIYLARQTGIKGFERIVVIKRIHPHLSREERFVEMFFDEARIAALLNHPNIVQIYDLGEDDGEYYIAMEYLEGESLGYVAREGRKGGKPMPQEVAAGIVAQVCDGLEHAHNFKDTVGNPMNIVHRDVSPQNIIVLFSGTTKLVDFGIAKAASKVHQTQAGTLKGKLTYMPPEQCQGKPVDGRSDVYSLGIVFWELLTGRRLFRRDNEAAIIHAIMSEPVPSVTNIRPHVSADLAAIAECALARSPGKRFQSAGAMGEAIRQTLHRANAQAGVSIIARYAREVLSGREDAKKDILRSIQEGKGGQIQVNILKPDTEESLPTGSEAAHVSNTGRDYAAIADAKTQIRPSEIDAEPEAPAGPVQDTGPKVEVDQGEWFEGDDATDPLPDAGLDDDLPKKGFPKAALVALPILLILIGVGLWYLFGQGTTGDPAQPADPLEGAIPLKPDAGQAESLDAAVAADPTPAPQDGGTQVATRGSDPVQTDPPKVDPPAKALLSVRSKPTGCKVQVDGALAPRKTPLKGLRVDPNAEHAVEVTCRAHKPEVKRFTAKPGEKIALAFAPTRLQSRPPKPKPPKPPRPKPPKVGKKGSLRLDTTPWSVIFLGKRKLGMTPLLGVEIPAGKHTLTAVNKAKGLKKSIKVTVRPGKTTTLHVDLKK